MLETESGHKLFFEEKEMYIKAENNPLIGHPK